MILFLKDQVQKLKGVIQELKIKISVVITACSYTMSKSGLGVQTFNVI